MTISSQNVFVVPEVDLFASRFICKVQKYVSFQHDPQEWKVNAFNLEWSNFFGYAFPPTNQISKVLQKVKKEKAHIILIGPDWPMQSWYTEAMNMTINMFSFSFREISDLARAQPKLGSWMLMPTNTLITGDQHALMPTQAQAQTALEVTRDQHELMLATCKQEIGKVHDVEINETARELISSAGQESSKNTYAIYLRNYKKIADANNFDYLQPTETQVANFLSSCFDKGYGYSAIKVARAAVS